MAYKMPGYKSGNPQGYDHQFDSAYSQSKGARAPSQAPPPPGPGNPAHAGGVPAPSQGSYANQYDAAHNPPAGRDHRASPKPIRAAHNGGVPAPDPSQGGYNHQFDGRNRQTGSSHVKEGYDKSFDNAHAGNSRQIGHGAPGNYQGYWDRRYDTSPSGGGTIRSLAQDVAYDLRYGGLEGNSRQSQHGTPGYDSRHESTGSSSNSSHYGSSSYDSLHEAVNKQTSGNAGKAEGYDRRFDRAHGMSGGRNARGNVMGATGYDSQFDRTHNNGGSPGYGENKPNPQVSDSGDDFVFGAEDWQRRKVRVDGNVAHTGDDDTDLYSAALSADRWRWDGDSVPKAMGSGGVVNTSWLRKVAEGRGDMAQLAALEMKQRTVRGKG